MLPAVLGMMGMHHPIQPFLLRGVLWTFLPKLTWNCDLPDLYLLSS
jgi:hypothetical protein